MADQEYNEADDLGDFQGTEINFAHDVRARSPMPSRRKVCGLISGKKVATHSAQP